MGARTLDFQFSPVQERENVEREASAYSGTQRYLFEAQWYLTA